MSVDRNGTGPGALPSSPAELEAVIAQRRERLAATVDELVHRAQPKEIARRSVADAKVRFADATRTDEGELRTERIAAVAGAVAAFLAVVYLLRRRRSRRDR